jgi:hypothetical protein
VEGDVDNEGADLVDQGRVGREQFRRRKTELQIGVESAADRRSMIALWLKEF